MSNGIGVESCTMSDIFVYFRAPQGMRGIKLRPLSQLKHLYPKVYELETAKYRGREHIMKTQIPYLKCFWNDVIHLATVHPNVVYNALLAAGAKDLPELDWLEIPISHLEHLELVYLEYKNTTKSSLKPQVQFSSIAPEEVSPTLTVPEVTLRYYREELNLDRMPLFLFGTPHILTKGPVETGDVRIFDWRTPVEDPINPLEPEQISQEKSKNE